MRYLSSNVKITIRINGLAESGPGYTDICTGWIYLPVILNDETAIEAGKVIQYETEKLFDGIKRMDLTELWEKINEGV